MEQGLDRVSWADKKERKVWKKVSEQDLASLASELKAILVKPTVIILSGEVGAGKTTFTKEFIGNSGDVHSPSYSLINEVGSFAHADFYRIEDSEELIHLEISLYLEGKQFFIVEWGLPYATQLRKEIDQRFDFFELHLDISHDAVDRTEDAPTRDFILYEMIEL